MSKKFKFSILGIVLLTILSGGAFYLLNKNKITQEPSEQNTTQPTTEEMPTVIKLPDSASTFDAPEKITTKDNAQYFYYGAPAGQNNANPKKILITLHGTEGGAEKDFAIWKPFVVDAGYALASLNWWDGSGDDTTDYATPEKINTYIHEFLTAQGYAKTDLIVFEGFSRGSANSFSVAAFDQASSSPLIDVVVSSSGGGQEAYFNLTTKNIEQKAKSNTIFKNVYWITACGGKDENPERDGCTAMQSASNFVAGKGATVLGNLADPNAGHGALTTSTLNLPKQMFELIDAKF